MPTQQEILDAYLDSLNKTGAAQYAQPDQVGTTQQDILNSYLQSIGQPTQGIQPVQFQPITFQPTGTTSQPVHPIQGEISPFDVPQDRSLGGFFDNVLKDAGEILNLRNLTMGTTALLGGVSRAGAELFGAPSLEEGQWIDWKGEIRSGSPQNFADSMAAMFWSGPSLGEMGASIVEPYWQSIQQGSLEPVGDYIYEHPLQFAIDMSMLAEGVNLAVKGGLRGAQLAGMDIGRAESWLTRTRAPLQAGNRIIPREYAPNVIAQAGQRLWDVTLGATPTGRAATEAAFIPMDRMSQMLRTFGRSIEQRIIDSHFGTWLGQSQFIQRTDLNLFNRAKLGLLPEDIPRFNNEFRAAVRFQTPPKLQFNPRTRLWEPVSTEATAFWDNVMNEAVRSGDLLPQTVESLRAWREIVSSRRQRMLERGILTEEQILKSETQYAAELGLSQELGTGRYTTAQERAGREIGYPEMDLGETLTDAEILAAFRGEFESVTSTPQSRLVEVMAKEGHDPVYAVHPETNQVYLPVDPLAAREDLALLRTHPELFQFTGDGMNWTTPLYYPSSFAQDLAHTTFRDVLPALMDFQKSKPGWLKERTGALFRWGIEDSNVQQVITRNIRSVAHYEAMTNVLDSTILDFSANNHFAEMFPDIFKELKEPIVGADGQSINYRLKRRPPSTGPHANPEAVAQWDAAMASLRQTMQDEGYRWAFPDGFRMWWEDGGMEEIVTRLAKKIEDEGKIAQEMEATFAERMSNLFAGESEEAITMADGIGHIIPNQVADHIRQHLAPSSPVVELMFDGHKKFWAPFVLSFRPAWQVVNAFTNAALTTISGNWRGLKYMFDPEFRRMLPGEIYGSSIMPELGMLGDVVEGAGFSWQTQNWLRQHAPAFAEPLINFNQWIHRGPIHRGGKAIAQFQQMVDDTFKGINFFGELERDVVARGQVTRTVGAVRDAMREVLSPMLKPGETARVQDLVSRTADAVYHWNALAPWQRRYLTSFLPFSGWRLFTLGYAMRLPVQYPGRAWALRALNDMGKTYIEDLWELNGIDPATVPDWEQFSIPLMANDEGEVLTFRGSMFRMYDFLGTNDIMSSALAHPAVQFAFEQISGTRTYPEIGPITRPPIEWGEEGPARRNFFDNVGETLFGSVWNLGEKIIHPYAQYGTGGMFNPEPIVSQGELITEGYTAGDAVLQHVGGFSFRGLESYDMMSRAHSTFLSSVDGAFRALEDSIMDPRGQDRGNVRSIAGLYLERAQVALAQNSVMQENTTSERNLGFLGTEYTTITNRMARILDLLTWMDNNPTLRVDPYIIHGSTWKAPETEVSE